ncbi:hypothetical protein [Pseudobdellovibrio exovorus]|uniref:Uncharacterized protein n=1 Tax=Pseudobdellovibrio exovorus JSS TaxID=1184267 RepID=M4VTT3_9BACT|nr:hypothetical protein [Pseudobdellovibrio exovorus]AGH96614.1 hypothetical protein A11Q_2398 [Pseudobdellovibrio exovorus JSS]
MAKKKTKKEIEVEKELRANKRIKKIVAKKLRKSHELSESEVAYLEICMGALLQDNPKMPDKKLWIKAVEQTTKQMIKGFKNRLEKRFNEIKNR